jgi:hypothetical protein
LVSSGFKEFHETIHLVKADRFARHCLPSMSTLLDEAFREIFSWRLQLGNRGAPAGMKRRGWRFPVLTVTRRKFLGSAVAASLCSRMDFAQEEKLRIGVTDWNLNLGASPEALPLAAKLGFDGVQISFGRKLVDGKMPADNPEVIAHYLSFSKQYKLPIDGTCVDKLDDNGLKSDPLGPKWVLDSIRLTKALDTKVLLLPFFGPSALQTKQER